MDNFIVVLQTLDGQKSCLVFRYLWGEKMAKIHEWTQAKRHEGERHDFERDGNIEFIIVFI